MNKVVNINLNGFVFSIDEQAYELLKQYTDRLRRHFAGTEGAGEIISDIETRMAELLQQKLGTQSQVVMLEDVQHVIALMGEPWQIEDEPAEQVKEEFEGNYVSDGPKRLRRDPSNKVIGGVCGGAANYAGVDPVVFRALFAIAFFVFGSGLLIYIVLWIAVPKAKPGELSTFKHAKRMFRNPDEKIMGGVCGGLGSYFRIDPVWFRIAFMVAFFFYGSGFLLYIVLWFAIPKARSAADKLQMKGEAVDVNNIEREIRNASRPNAFRQGLNNTGGMLSELFRNVLKLFTRIVGFFMLSAGVMGLVVFYVSLMSRGRWSRFLTLFADDPTTLMFVKIGMVMAVSAVVVVFVTSGIKLLFGIRFRTRVLNVIMLIMFITGCVFEGLGVAQFVHSIHEKESVNEKVASFSAPDTLYLKVSDKWKGDSSRKKLFDISFNDDDVFSIKRVGDVGTLIGSNTLKISPSEDTTVTISMIKSAHASSDAGARERAKAIQYAVTVDGSAVTLDQGIFVELGETYHLENVRVQMRIPVGTIIRVDPEVLIMINRRTHDYDMGETFRMGKKGLICLDCDDDDESDEWDEDNDEININLGDDHDNDGEHKDVKIRIGGDDKIRVKETETIEMRDGQKIRRTVKKVGPVTVTKEVEIEKEK